MHVEELRAYQLETDFNLPQSIRDCIALEELLFRVIDGTIRVGNKLQLIGSAHRTSIDKFLDGASEKLKQKVITLYEQVSKSVEIINNSQNTETKHKELKDLLRANATSEESSSTISYLSLILLEIGNFSSEEKIIFHSNLVEIFSNGLNQSELEEALNLSEVLIVGRKRDREKSLAHLLRYSPTNWNRSFIRSDSTLEFIEHDNSTLKLNMLSILRLMITRDEHVTPELRQNVLAYFNDGAIRHDLIYKNVDVNTFLIDHPPHSSISTLVSERLKYLTDSGLRDFVSKRLNNYYADSHKTLSNIFVPNNPNSTIKNIVEFSAVYLLKMFPGIASPAKMMEIWFDNFTEEMAFTDFLRRSYLQVHGTYLNGCPEAIITYALEDLWQHFLFESPKELFEELRYFEISTIQGGVDREEIDLIEVQAQEDTRALAIIRPGSNSRIDQNFGRFIDKLYELAGIE